MKYIFTLFSLFICFLSNGQSLIINSSNFVANHQTDSLLSAAVSNVKIPIGGLSSVWDYSTLQQNGVFVLNYRTTNDSMFGKTYHLLTDQIDPLNQQASLDMEVGYFIDSTGYYVMGSYYPEFRTDIGAYTGSAGDSIIIPEQYNYFSNPLYQIKFPSSFQTVTKINTIRFLNMKITIQGEGIINAPISKVRFISRIDSVMGEGVLYLPVNGGKSNGIKVLLIRRKTTTIDSLFLAGSPAPAQLLFGFGISQGQTQTGGSYIFVSPDDKTPILELYTGANMSIINSIRYKNKGLYNLGVQKNNNYSYNIFPSSAEYGTPVTIDFSGKYCYLQLINVTGQIMYNSVTLPGTKINPEKGIYWLRLMDDAGNIFQSQIIRY